MGEPGAADITALFAEAIGLTPDGRAALLDRLRSTDHRSPISSPRCSRPMPRQTPRSPRAG